MKRAFAIWFVCSMLGALLTILLPEDLLGSGRLFSLSEGHGPSASDAIGIGVILAGWAWFVRASWIEWRGRETRWPGIALAMLAAAGAALCLIAISADRNLAAIVFGSVAVTAQIALAVIPHCFAARESK